MVEQTTERLGYVVLGVDDLAAATEFYRQIGHLTVHESTSTAVCLGGGYDHHWLRLEKSDGERGMRRIGYQLAASETLDGVADRLSEREIAFEEFGDLDGDGIDRGIRFVDPDGVRIDVFTQMLSRAVKPAQDIVRMRDMLHAVWFSADAVAAHDFYHDVLGFRASDWIKRKAVFMRSANNYHHSLGIFGADPARVGKMDHFCILVDSVDDVMRGRNVAMRSGAVIQKDVLRHAASGSISVYITDPYTGVSLEFCSDHDVVPADHRPRLLEGSALTRDVWLAGSPAEDIATLSQVGMGVTTTMADEQGGGSLGDRVASVANALA